MARQTSKQKEVRQNKILKVASTLFLEQGFEQTSTKQIAQEVGIAEGTIFNYFDSKTDLFFSTILYEFEIDPKNNPALTYDSDDIVQAIIDHLKNMLKLLLKLPKRVLSELLMASVKMAKKRPSRFKQFAEIDFNYMAMIADYFKTLQTHGMLKGVDVVLLSEIVYSIFAYELLMYVYDKSVSKETLFNNMGQKLQLILSDKLGGNQ
jgi:AcrR family transcriptional regulator